jgi:hypothetical protein
MAVYALSGIILIFRDTNFLKKTNHISQQLKPGLSPEELGKAIRIRDLKIEATNGDTQTFKTGTYNTQTGGVNYSTKSLPFLVEKLNHLHKANTKHPLFFLNIFLVPRCCSLFFPLFGCLCPRQQFLKRGFILPWQVLC